MKHYVFFCAIILAGCSYSQPTLEAKEYIGLHEKTDREELKQILGLDPVRTEWCAAFVNAMLELDGIPSLNEINHPYPLTARAFLDWGSSINTQDIEYGDLVIFPRGNEGWQGHVGFYVGRYRTGEWIILGGNQVDSVRYNLYDPNRALGIRRWVE